MQSLSLISLFVGALLLLLGAGYGYFIYAPKPLLLPLSATIREAAIRVGQRSRTYLAYVPVNLPPNPGLVLVLHGSNIDGKTIRAWTGYAFDELADRYGFIVLYPDGYKQNWNDCRINAPFPANKENIDDVGFMRALVGQFQTEQGVDPAKVFAFGYSNGGQMAFRLALEEPRFVAAVTAIGANLPTPDNFACTGSGPTARVMLVNGTADPIMPYEGGEVTLFGFASRGMALSARATAEYFAERNGSTSVPVAVPDIVQTGRGSLPVSQLIWTRAAQSGEDPSQAGQSMVELYTVAGGGHVVPQGKFRFPRINGKTATNLDTPAIAVAFFGLMHERFPQ